MAKTAGGCQQPRGDGRRCRRRAANGFDCGMHNTAAGAASAAGASSATASGATDGVASADPMDESTWTLVDSHTGDILAQGDLSETLANPELPSQMVGNAIAKPGALTEDEARELATEVDRDMRQLAEEIRQEREGG